MKPKVLIPHPIHAQGVEFLRERGYEVQVGCDASASGLIQAVRECDALLVRTAEITDEILAHAPRLRVVAKHGVGVDNIDLEAATRREVWVVNAPHSNSETVAEWTVGALVALARGFVASQSALRAGDWEYRNRVTGCDLAGKTLGIVGLGRIGSSVARRAALGLEMRVIAFDPFAHAPEGVAVEMVGEREELLKRADFVTLHLPGGAANRATIGARELGLMKPGSFLINACRGEVVDETALIQALQSGHLAGAALDVFETEPPAPDNPLLRMDNVLATPHNAALTREATRRMALDAARGVDEVLRGHTPTWPVNAPQLGQK